MLLVGRHHINLTFGILLNPNKLIMRSFIINMVALLLNIEISLTGKPLTYKMDTSLLTVLDNPG